MVLIYTVTELSLLNLTELYFTSHFAVLMPQTSEYSLKPVRCFMRHGTTLLKYKIHTHTHGFESVLNCTQLTCAIIQNLIKMSSNFVSQPWCFILQIFIHIQVEQPTRLGPALHIHTSAALRSWLNRLSYKSSFKSFFYHFIYFSFHCSLSQL